MMIALLLNSEVVVLPSKLTGTFIGGIIHCLDLKEPDFEIVQKHQEPHDCLYQDFSDGVYTSNLFFRDMKQN